jgi:hypothetical protein
MIHIDKGEEPETLKANKEVWTEEYLDALEKGSATPVSIRYRYRHKDIKTALQKEAENKCIYCERKIPFGETDHISPVSKCPELIVAWKNLGLSCKECNTYKGNYYSDNEQLINPFEDQPEEHLLFFGPMILQQVGDMKGFRTVEQLCLRRTELIERRKERIEQLQGLVEQWNSLPEGNTKEITKSKILEEAENDKEFSAIVRAYLLQALGWENEKL